MSADSPRSWRRRADWRGSPSPHVQRDDRSCSSEYSRWPTATPLPRADALRRSLALLRNGQCLKSNGVATRAHSDEAGGTEQCPQLLGGAIMGVQLSELAGEIIGESVTTHRRGDEAPTRPERGQATAVEVVEDPVGQKFTEAQRHNDVDVARDRSRLQRIGTNEVETAMASRQFPGQCERFRIDVDADESGALVTTWIAAAHRLRNVE